MPIKTQAHLFDFRFHGLSPLGRAILIPAMLEKAVNKMDIRIYAGNLAKTTTNEELNALFATAGTVNSVEVVKDRTSGESKGFAFISMATQEEADKAIGMFNAYSFAGNELKVNIAKPREEKTPSAKR